MTGNVGVQGGVHPCRDVEYPLSTGKDGDKVCVSPALRADMAKGRHVVTQKTTDDGLKYPGVLDKKSEEEVGSFLREREKGDEWCLLSKADMLKLEEWNRAVPEQVDRCVHELITEWCRAQPDAPAVCAWDGKFTYAELDALSSALAAHLAERGVGSEIFVPLCFEKSRWTTVALVAVMKAGGAFMLLDPSQPLLRLQELCAAVKATLVLSSPTNESRSKELADTVIVLSSTQGFLSSCDLHDYRAKALTQPHHAAYATFTSGSTGKPKVVVVAHSAYCANALAHSNAIQLNKDSRVLQLASYAFGVSIVQLVTTLMVGGCVCVPSDSECRDNIAAAVHRLKANWAVFTPSVLRTVRHKDMSNLKHVILSGETPVRNNITAWPDHVQVTIAYGSAETVCCTVAQNMGPLSSPKLIGKMTGSVGWVVEPDNHHKLVPLGAIGELLVEGPILARGYLNDAKKTTEAFIEAPSWFSTFCERYNKMSRRGGRMYKTGDLVQYHADGSLTLVGRKDTQVKIRGQRVELGEVEYHVQQSLAGDTSPLVVAEVVTPRGSNRPMLVTYLAIGEAANESQECVRATLDRWMQGAEERLMEQVPRYMVPSAYLAVDKIPMTATGKTDRRRLREMGGALTLEQVIEMQPSRGALCAPVTVMEMRLQGMWADVLNLPADRIRTDDSFFRLGGDSIDAVQLVAAAREKGLSLTVADVFNMPRLSQMAHVVKAGGYVEETIVPFSLLQLGIDVNVARAQAAAQCGVDINLVEDVFPCTPLQEGMLAMTAKRPGDYVRQTLFELRVGVEPKRLEQAWREVVATMPILRTRVVNLAEQGLVQVVVGGQGSFTACQDLEAYLQADKQDAMGLGAPLSRFATLDSCSCRRPVLVWTVHHALFDGWSMPLVLKQVEQTYHGHTRDRLVPFQGFVKHILQSGDGIHEYWQSQLSGSEAVPFPSLPWSGYQPQADDGLAHQISGLQWPQSDITASTAVRVAWAILLARYMNSPDVIFGATVNGRQAPVLGIERMASPTFATVPIRVKLDWDMGVLDLLRQVQTQAVGMTQYEQTGLQQIQRIGPDLEQRSQFQTLVVVEPSARDNDTENKKLFQARSDADEDSVKGLNTFTTYAILAECRLAKDGIQLRISFDSQVIERVQVKRLAQQFEHVLRQVCADNTAPLIVKDVGTVSEQDLWEIGTWNETVPMRGDRCVHDVIVERCRAQPDAPAVNAWDGDFTYGDLDELSSRLAYHLGTFNLTPGTIIPLCFEKTKWAIVAVLGVLRAGAAYAMVDPTCPTARTKSVCEDLKADLMVCSISCVSKASQLVARVIAVEPVVRNKVMNTSAGPKDPPVNLTDPIYAAFSSGSTGRPKGVVIEHGGFLQQAMTNGTALSLSSESRVLQFASFVFDVANRDILYTLLFGGCICIPSDLQRSDKLTAFMGEQRVNWTSITPSASRILDPDELPTLRHMVLCGEPMNPGLVATWADRLHLINAYGTSEATGISSMTTVTHMTSPAKIGKGSGSVLWIVDPADHNRLAPVGAVGELLIESPSVGRGYLNRPAETASSFLSTTAWFSQFRTDPTCRLYKTGDLVQYAADGSLRFVGRKDTQAKIRGQRIELGEVEHHTRRSFPGARDVVAEVVTPAEAGRAPMLVAFVWVDISDQEARNIDEKDESDKDKRNEDKRNEDKRNEDKAEEILAAPTDSFRAAIPVAETTLLDAVPAYMVPAVFLPLRAVPQSTTGKTDRQRLRNRAAILSRADIEAYRGSAAAKRRPATPAERSLQALWAQVLNLSPDEIGADDSFFRLGGDSITATQLSAHLRSAGFSLSVSDIFHAKTLARLAPLLDNATSPSLDHDEREDVPFELSPIQQLFFDLMPSGTNYFNQSFLLPVAQRLTLGDATQAVNMIVHHHSALRTRFRQANDGRWVQVVTAPIDRSCRCQGVVVPSLDEARDVMRASQRCLNFQDGPMLAVDLIDVDSKKQYLFLVAHHLVIDLVSWRILLGDLEELLQTGKLSGTRPLPFQAWCHLQAEYSHEALAPAVALLSPSPPALQDYWGLVGHQNTWGNTLGSEFFLTEALTTAVFGAANNALRTQPVEIFQAALWHAFVHAFPDRPPPTIFNEGHGREPWDPAIDLSRTVGWFTTMWPTYIKVDSPASIIDVIRHTKDARRRTPSNGWAYFASRFLNPAGRTAFEIHGPVEIAFNYLGLYQQFEREGAILRPPIRLENHISDVGDDMQRFALIDVSVAVERGRLRFSFHYNRYMQHQDAISRWIANCEQSLQDAVRQLTSMGSTHSLCDFPLLDLTYSSLDRLLNQTLANSGVTPQEGEDVYPCSPMQRGLLLSQAKDARLYQTRFVWKVAPKAGVGSVDIDRLRQAWQQVVARHAILRTIFVDSESETGCFDQVVRRSSVANIEVIKVLESANNNPIVTLQRYPRATNQDGQPPHRLLLCATSTETCCALEINHALVDAHSTRILQRDLRLAYDGQLPAEPAPLYYDYIAYLGSLSEANAETYWRLYMEGVQPCLFPTREIDDTRSQLGKELRSASISLGAGAHLHEFCQRHEVTLSNLFQVAWGLVLQAYTGSDAACFGYLNSGRDVPVPGVHDTVGPFINMLVCRVETDAEASVLSMLQKNQVEYLQGLPHQHCSLAGILHQANAGGRPLFNTVISLQRPRNSEEQREVERQCSITLETAGAENPTEVRSYPARSIANPRWPMLGYDAKQEWL
jgi:amino acid adenylation domain-containing protein/non-ribosomal peptide synthase protein (TIGR01720 family)